MAKQCQAPNCNNPAQSHGYCFPHGYLRTDDKYKKPVIHIKNDSEPTLEGAFLQSIINTRKHISFITGLPIENLTHFNTHHVLPKSHYPAYRLFDKNIIFLSNEEHFAVHNLAKSDLIAKDSRWQKYYDYYEILKESYNK